MSNKKQSKQKRITLQQRVTMLEHAVAQMADILRAHHSVLEQAAAEANAAEAQRLQAAGLEKPTTESEA